MTHSPNRLIKEHSPYLRHHAHNPVDWYPWGDEAFARALENDMPVFVSIGYAACHWCHVMETVCFEDEVVASLLNAHFVSVKVDREERPDIDQVYMAVCQAMTGSGGWPLHVFLTPDKRPFYAATFIPKMSSPNMPGMLDLLPYLASVWRDEREKVSDVSDQIMSAIQEQARRGTLHDPDELIHTAARRLTALYDKKYGGFSPAPKFPSVPVLLFLLRYAVIHQDRSILDMITTTLNRMAWGGMRDHLDGGFHRYATDTAWKLPHFEKMLSDQAMCAIIYTEIWQVTKQDRYRRLARSVLEYMTTVLSDAPGGFSSSEDADSPGGEGAYYLWSYDEIEKIFGEEARLVCTMFGITREGNVSGMHGMKPGDNVLFPERDPLEILSAAGVRDPEKTYASILNRLTNARKERERPPLDDKVLTDWNALAIQALAFAGMVFHDESLCTRAISAAEFLFSNMVRPDGSVLHRWRNGQGGIEGTAGDYVHLAWACVTLYQTTGNSLWLRRAISLEKSASDRFYDSVHGGYFLVPSATDLPVRMKEMTDGPTFSTNGAGYLLLCALYSITGDGSYRQKARQTEGYHRSLDPRMITGCCTFLCGLIEKNVRGTAVLCNTSGSTGDDEIWSLLWSSYLPGMIRIPIRERSDSDFLPMSVQCQGDTPALHICSHRQCHPPITTVDEVRHYIRGLDIFQGDEISDTIQAPDQ